MHIGHRLKQTSEAQGYETSESCRPLTLGDLRRQRGASQAEVASAMGTAQSSVSRTERQPDILLSTLHQYVQGLGGQLRLYVDIRDERFEIDLPATRRDVEAIAEREFRVVWQDPDSRGFKQIGWLRFGGGQYTFSYTDEARETDSFQPFPSFPSLTDLYKSKELFPFFSGRVMSATSPDFEELTNALGLTRETTTPVELLALGQADSPHDTIHVVPEPIEHENGTSERTFLVSGVRHANEDDPDSVGALVAALEAGALLELRREPTNPKNPRALQLATDDVVVGWVPDYLLDEVHGHLGAQRDLRFAVVKANGSATPWHLRLSCRMTAAPSL